MADDDGPGPAWLGIGAPRCGTTWFTNLLLQHPAVSLVGGKKELHQLYRGLTGRFDAGAYRAKFDIPGVLAGECTPYYLRALWVPQVARAVLRPGAPVYVLLRDPVERFQSAVRLNQRLNADRRSRGEAELPLRLFAGDATWAGMYATHLAAWERELGRDRMVVLQHERVRPDPRPAVADVWGRMGLDPVGLADVAAPTRNSTPEGWVLPDRLRAELVAAYRPEVARLREWGVDPGLWPNFAGTA